MAWRGWVVLVMSVGVAGLAASLYWWPEPAPPVAVLGEASCVNDPEIVGGIVSGATLDIAARSEAGGAPLGFVATSVMVCATTDVAAATSETFVRQSTFIGDAVSALQNSFEQSSYEFTWSGLGGCAGDYPTPPVVWLIDESGAGFRPVFPTDHCGRPITEPLQLFDALTVRDVKEVPAFDSK